MYASMPTVNFASQKKKKKDTDYQCKENNMKCYSETSQFQQPTQGNEFKGNMSASTDQHGSNPQLPIPCSWNHQNPLSNTSNNQIPTLQPIKWSIIQLIQS